MEPKKKSIFGDRDDLRVAAKIARLLDPFTPGDCRFILEMAGRQSCTPTQQEVAEKLRSLEKEQRMAQVAPGVVLRRQAVDPGRMGPNGQMGIPEGYELRPIARVSERFANGIEP